MAPLQAQDGLSAGRSRRPGQTRRRASPGRCSSQPTCCPRRSRPTSASTRTSRVARRRPRPRADADPGARASAENGAHQNPFLVPEAARVEHRPRSTRRRMIAALLASPRGLDQRPPRVISTSAPPCGNAPLAGRAAPDPPAGARGFDRRRRGHGCDRHAPERGPSVVHVCSRRSRATRYARRGGLSLRRATRSRNRQRLAIERIRPGATSARAPDESRTHRRPATGSETRGGAGAVHAADI